MITMLHYAARHGELRSVSFVADVDDEEGRQLLALLDEMVLDEIGGGVVRWIRCADGAGFEPWSFRWRGPSVVAANGRRVVATITRLPPLASIVPPPTERRVWN